MCLFSLCFLCRLQRIGKQIEHLFFRLIYTFHRASSMRVSDVLKLFSLCVGFIVSSVKRQSVFICSCSLISHLKHSVHLLQDCFMGIGFVRFCILFPVFRTNDFFLFSISLYTFILLLLFLLHL